MCTTTPNRPLTHPPTTPPPSPQFPFPTHPHTLQAAEKLEERRQTAKGGKKLGLTAMMRQMQVPVQSTAASGDVVASGDGTAESSDEGNA